MGGKAFTYIFALPNTILDSRAKRKMQRVSNGWDTTSYDYHSHVSSLERMPSVFTDVPHYPNVHMAFNNNVTTYEEIPEVKQQKHHPEDAKKKVHFVEEEKLIVCDKNGECKVIEESIDVEADGFIQKKHKNFELCKWATFKMN